MAWRCRNCGLHVVAEHGDYPRPERLALLAPHMAILVEAAAEYQRVGGDEEPGSVLEFLTWLEVDVNRAAGWTPRLAIRRGEPGVNRR
jgi:hypothetical protein